MGTVLISLLDLFRSLDYLVVLVGLLVVIDSLRHLVEFFNLIVLVGFPHGVLLIDIHLMPVEIIEVSPIVDGVDRRKVIFLGLIEFEQLLEDDGFFPIFLKGILEFN
jgi:hypothetical protein